MADGYRVVIVPGLPEVVPGDPLAAWIADAVAAATAALEPLRDDDVLVVTQKVVSKAEGAIVDLTTIEPRPEAIVGPASGSVVTLLPADPDASADRIRAAVRERTGVDVPVIVSDSFGRPWRFGIVDVAIGVSGLLPLDDLRGQPDADGRIMKSTVRAVADELASAAELALGKAAGQPLALVRGAAFTRGEGGIADTLIPAEWDLFR